MLTSGFSIPSNEFSGATPPSSAEINGNGTIIEPNLSNSFTLLQKQILVNTIEHYNITRSELNSIFTESYSSSQEMTNAGAYYGTKYLIIQNINDFIGNVTNDVILALGGSNGTGDNPQFAVEKPPT